MPSGSRVEKKPRRLPGGFRFALRGLRCFLVSTPNAWVHVVAALAALGLGAWLQVDLEALALLLLAIGLVLVTEVINTAIEATVDLVTAEIHPQAAVAKDVAAAAVFVAAIIAVLVGVLVLGPPLLGR